MSQFFTVVGAAILIFCAIWGYSWLEVWRDPKGELVDFYARHPRTKALVSLANRLWVPTLVAGLIFVISGVMTGGK
jgi:hypothetical protein